MLAGWATILFLAGSSLSYAIAPGDVVDMIQTRQNRVYEDCRIFKVDPDGLMFSHRAGAAKILYADMNPETLRRVGYDKGGDHAEESHRATTVSPRPMALTGGDNVEPAPPLPPSLNGPMTPGPWAPQYVEPATPDDDYGIPTAPLWAPDLGDNENGYGNRHHRHCWSPFGRRAFTSGYVGSGNGGGGRYYGNGFGNGYFGRGYRGTAFYGSGYYGATCGSTSVSPVVQAPFWAVSPMRPAWLGTTQAVRRPVAPRPVGFNRPVPVGRVR